MSINTSLPIADKDRDWDSGSARKRIKAWAKDGAEVDFTKYTKAFMVVDGDSDNEGSYKLPYCDIINGELTIVPHAVYAIAGVIQGSRGGTEASTTEAKSACEKLYKKFATKFKDDSIVTPWLKDEKVEHSIGFSTTKAPTKAGGYNLYEAKIFETGEYPDKDFSLTDSQADEAILDFRPVGLDSQHGESPFDGKLGTLLDVKRVGKELFGTVAIPEPVDKILDHPARRKLSATWDKVSKKIVGLAMVKHPRVADAAFSVAFAEFAKSSEIISYEKNPNQVLHDISCCMGAECKGKKYFADVEFMTPEQLVIAQRHHDLAAESGADCDAFVTRKSAGMWTHEPGWNYSVDTERRFNMTDTEKTEFSEQISSLKALLATFEADAKKKATEAEDEKKKSEEEKKKSEEEKKAAEAKAEEAEKESKAKDEKIAKYSEDLEKLKANFAAIELAKAKEIAFSEIDAKQDEGKLLPVTAEKWKAKVEADFTAWAALKPLLEDLEPISAIEGFSDTRIKAGLKKVNANSKDEETLETYTKAHWSDVSASIAKNDAEVAKFGSVEAATIAKITTDFYANVTFGDK